MSTVAGRDSFEVALSSKPTAQVAGLARAEFDLSNTPLLGPLALEVRAAAALASFRTALYLLKGYQPFCRTVDVTLPVSNSIVRIRGVTLAYYRLRLAQDLLTGYSVEPFRAFAQSLQPYASKRLSYAAAAKDPATRAALSVAALDLDALTFDDRPIARANELIASIVKQFGSVGSGKLNAQALLQQLKDADLAEWALTSELNRILRGFQPTSPDYTVPIEVDALLARIEELDQRLHGLQITAEANRRFLNVLQKQDSETAFVQIGRLLAFNINIFSYEFKGGAKPLEVLRSAFVKSESAALGSLTEFSSGMEECLLSGGSQ